MVTFFTESTKIAAKYIRNGGIVAFPTETVYGLGANIFDEQAINKIFVAKKRPSDNPLIAHIGDLEQIKLIASEVNQIAQKLIDAFFPSPLTLVLKKTPEVPMIATANLETIGVRMPNNILTLDFLRECKTPIVAPSANLSGKPSPTTWQAVSDDLNSRIDCILQGEQTLFGLESTVVDCTSEIPLILRSGAITLEQLQKVAPQTQIYRISENEIAKSPGLKHRHYSPRANVELVDNIEFDVQGSNSFIGLKLPNNSFDLVKICNSVEDYAHELFAFFRECDNKNLANIYCQTVEEKGIGVALMDRLRRASEK
jgi:L-threonylcarbamoyladenylate synthase